MLPASVSSAAWPRKVAGTCGDTRRWTIYPTLAIGVVRYGGIFTSRALSEWRACVGGWIRLNGQYVWLWCDDVLLSVCVCLCVCNCVCICIIVLVIIKRCLTTSHYRYLYCNTAMMVPIPTHVLFISICHHPRDRHQLIVCPICWPYVC